jgi:hypothetical protein
VRCPFVPLAKSTHLKRATGTGAWNFDSKFRMIIGYAVPNIIEIYSLDGAVCHYVLAEYHRDMLTKVPKK